MREILLTATETLIDINDSCDNLDDTAFLIRLNGVEVNDTNVLDISSGLSVLNVTSTAKAWSCPQTAELEITLETI